MALEFDRAAAYRVPPAAGNRRPAASDEDGFTLAATALERLDPGVPPGPPPDRLVLVGDLPPSAEVDLPRFFGSAVPVERVPGGRGAVRRALATARSTSRGTVDLVAVDLGNGPGEPDAAVAVRFSAGQEPDGSVLDGSIADEESLSAAPLLRVGADLGPRHPSRWLGDFRSDGASPPPGPDVSTPLPAEGPVSQGAYVPKARYLENLPSRWRFVGQRCGACGTVGFPPRGRCRSCGATSPLEPFPLPLEGGTVVAMTTIGPGGQPTEFDDQVAAGGPYGVVLVELMPGVRVTLQVAADPRSIRIGDRVATRLRRLYPMEGEWRYGRKAVPFA